MTAMRSMPHYTFDSALELKDTGLLAADTNCQVDGADKIVAVGDGIFSGVVVIDVSAIEIASNDEEYLVVLQGSTSATFGSVYQNLAVMDFGATEVRPGTNNGGDSLVGRYLMPFVNIQADVTYPYLRLCVDVSGSIDTGINFTAWIGKTRAA
jgi:hypothetical protein